MNCDSHVAHTMLHIASLHVVWYHTLLAHHVVVWYVPWHHGWPAQQLLLLFVTHFALLL